MIDGEADARGMLSRYLQLHGMDVVEADSLGEADRQLSEGAFDLMVAELTTPEQAEWPEWKNLLTGHGEISLLVHGRKASEWPRINWMLGRKASFLGRPFSLSDFHWVLHQVI